MRPRTFWQYLGDEQYSPATAESYLYYVEKFLKQHPQAKRYDYRQVTEYLLGEVKRCSSQGTQNGLVAAIKAYYRYLREAGTRHDNPVEHFRFATRGRKQMQLQDLLTPEELSLLLRTRTERHPRFVLRNKIIISLLIYQGVTSSELAGLTRKQVDLENGTLYVPQSRSVNSRTLRLEAVQLEWWSQYIEQMPPFQAHDRLFITVKGDRFTVGSVRSVVRQLKWTIPGKPVDAETIRQSVIANWLNVQKLPLATVQEMAGHKWPSSTQAYKRMDVEEKRELLKQFHPLG